MACLWGIGRLLGGQGEPLELLRVLGMAYLPMLTLVFTPLPIAGPLLAFAGSIYALILMFIGLREVHRLSNGMTVLLVGALMT